MAPWTWIASSAGLDRVFRGVHLARLVSRVSRRRWRLSQAARQTSNRPISVPADVFAIGCSDRLVSPISSPSVVPLVGVRAGGVQKRLRERGAAAATVNRRP